VLLVVLVLQANSVNMHGLTRRSMALEYEGEID
jgi:hypothetical protein